MNTVCHDFITNSSLGSQLVPQDITQKIIDKLNPLPMLLEEFLVGLRGDDSFLYIGAHI